MTALLSWAVTLEGIGRNDQKVNNRVCHTLTVAEGITCEIATGKEDRDAISRGIKEGTWRFPPLFELGFALIQPGHRILDLGAHIGTFALAAAALGCHVVAVEASPYNASLLRESAIQNGFEWLQVVSAAVSDRAGTLEFIDAGPYGLIANTRISSPAIQVPAITVDELLDELGWEQVDLIKMDVEGSEVRALRGMSRLLSRPHAPMILYESNGHTLSMFNETPRHLMATVSEFGYENYLVEPGQLVPLRLDGFQANCNVDYFAVKPPFVAPQGWEFVLPFGIEETISRIVTACYHPHVHNRTYTAQALAEADHTILREPRVKQALSILGDDPDPEVRAAASWWTGDDSRPGPLPQKARMTLRERWTRLTDAFR